MTNPVVLFNATDSDGHQGLWESDGTAAGTFEIGGLDSAGISGANVDFDPTSFANVGNGELFRALDADDDVGLWFTNGSPGGTFEIGGPGDTGVAGAASLALGGLDPYAFFSLGSEVIFQGTDSSGDIGLWATNGTLAGTFEIGGVGDGGVAGVPSTGLRMLDEVSDFDGGLLFEARDSTGWEGLWFTNGATAGTRELVGGANAASKGAYKSYFDTGPAVTVGSVALFRALNSTDHFTLWKTDGTVAGTVEVGGLTNSAVTGDNTTYGLDVDDIVSIGSAAVFNGYDSAGDYGLWSSDGSVGNTVEIGGSGDKGVANAWSAGLDPYELTNIGGGKAVFAGLDSSDSWTLWVTNGTSAGTQELGGVWNAGLKRLFVAGELGVFTRLGNEALFVSEDASGNSTLWVTDGTVAGTYEIGGIGNAGVAGAPPAVSTQPIWWLTELSRSSRPAASTQDSGSPTERPRGRTS